MRQHNKARWAQNKVEEEPDLRANEHFEKKKKNRNSMTRTWTETNKLTKRNGDESYLFAWAEEHRREQSRTGLKTQVSRKKCNETDNRIKKISK